jgi:hypothetical protein
MNDHEGQIYASGRGTPQHPWPSAGTSPARRRCARPSEVIPGGNSKKDYREREKHKSKGWRTSHERARVVITMQENAKMQRKLMG